MMARSFTLCVTQTASAPFVHISSSIYITAFSCHWGDFVTIRTTQTDLSHVQLFCFATTVTSFKMSESEMGTHKTPNDPVKEQIAQDKFGKSYDELTAHERVQVGGTKGGIVTKGGPGEYGGHYAGEGTRTSVEHTGDAAKEEGNA